MRRVPGERFWGFGIRSDEVERTDRMVECCVSEGPYQLDEYLLVEALTPRWAVRRRRDATYFPIPWLLSSDGFGVLVENSELSRFRFEAEDTWSLEVLSPTLRLRLFAAQTPADILRRYTEIVGRQPYPAAAWFLGPWCQTGQADLVPLDMEAQIIATLREADAPISAVETHMRRLPAGAHEGRRDDERARARLFHDHGLASLTYLNPFLSADYTERFADAEPLLEQRSDGSAYLFPAYIGGRESFLTLEGQLDFTREAARDFLRKIAHEAVEDGHDGWMEDFGEYTPVDSKSADGTIGAQAHNLYPVRYHAAGEAAGGRSTARFARSGWTGAAAHLPLVWGGDPTTGWGFDGLASALTQALSAGLSGIAFFGTDIGGFFTLGHQELDAELLIRWIQLGALLPLMRTKAEGVAVPPRRRPQIWDPEILPQWRRWAKLHTQLSPYLLGAAAEYVETGMPLVRHLCLNAPGDLAAQRSDQYLLGPSLLVVPVLEKGARERTVTLPPGSWIDLWRSTAYDTETSSLRLRSIRTLEGGRDVVLPASLDEIPVLARAGSVIPLLAEDVWSLAQPASDRRLRLLAMPGEGNSRLWREGRVHSRLNAQSWDMRLAIDHECEVEVQAALSFEPRSVSATGGPLQHWRFDPGTCVITISTSGSQIAIAVNA